MKCQACKTEIAESMKASITRNLCPFCGESIMTSSQVKTRMVLAQAIARATDRNQSLKNLSSAEAIETLAGILSMELGDSSIIDTSSQLPVPARTSAPSQSRAEDVVEVSEVTEDEPVVSASIHGAKEEGGRIQIPDHLRPKNRKAPKPISRGGEDISVPNGYAPAVHMPDEFSLEDLSGLAENLDMVPGGGDSLADLDDSSFFASGSSEVINVDGEDVVFGTSNSGINDRALALKQQHKKNMSKAGISINRPVSRVG